MTLNFEFLQVSVATDFLRKVPFCHVEHFLSWIWLVTVW